MNDQERSWKEEADRLVAAPTFSFDAAARLAAAILRGSQDPNLLAVAKEVLPALKAASAKGSDSFRRGIARRRFGRVRDALFALSAPRFGRRARRPPGGWQSGRTDAALGRELLGLPQDRPLTAAEIATAFKRAAKSAHPDRGGNADAFARLVAARDALLRQG